MLLGGVALSSTRYNPTTSTKPLRKKEQQMPIRGEQARRQRQGGTLHDAAARGDVETLRTLLDAKCDTTYIDASDRAGRAPLMWAAQNGHTDCAQLLLQRGADVRRRSRSKSTAAHIAAGRGCSETLLALLDAGCDVDARDFLGMTPAICAAQGGHTDCVQLLLKHGADISRFDDDKLTAVHYAIASANLNVVRLLFASTADPITLDPLFRLRYPPVMSKLTDSVSFALACGCRLEAPCDAIEATGASCMRPIICGCYSLSISCEGSKTSD